jgi:hypothetical protein
MRGLKMKSGSRKRGEASSDVLNSLNLPGADGVEVEVEVEVEVK